MLYISGKGTLLIFESISVRELASHFISHVAWTGERCPPPCPSTLAAYSTKESRPCTRPGYWIVLTLLVVAHVNLTCGREPVRAHTVPLICYMVVKES